jgi:hypothetical protein
VPIGAAAGATLAGLKVSACRHPAQCWRPLSVLPLLRQPPRLLKGSFCIAQEHRDNALNTLSHFGIQVAMKSLEIGDRGRDLSS